jgi:hypothetical protein
MLDLASVFSFKPDAASTQAVNEQTNKECKMLGHKYLPPESLSLRGHQRKSSHSIRVMCFCHLDLVLCSFLLPQGALDINTSELAGGECKLGDHALMLQEKHKVSSPL